MVKISASSLNLVNEGEELIKYAMLLQDSGADYLHCDVIDGKFTPAEYLDVESVDELSYKTLLPLDVHLMVEKPIDVLEKYSKLKVLYLTTHFEVYLDDFEILRAIEIVHKKGILFGLSVKPETRIERVFRFLPYIDLLLIMSVEPGKSGQSFMEKSLQRIKQAKAFIKKHKLKCKIEADGGINENNIQAIVDAGADIVVMASAIYKQKDKKAFISRLKKTKPNIKNEKKV